VGRLITRAPRPGTGRAYVALAGDDAVAVLNWELIDWQATTSRPVPAALKAEVAKSLSGAGGD
jgi:hypothetical protein